MSFSGPFFDARQFLRIYAVYFMSINNQRTCQESPQDCSKVCKINKGAWKGEYCNVDMRGGNIRQSARGVSIVKTNISRNNRLIRAAIGALLIGIALVASSLPSWFLIIVGAILLLTAVIGFCPINYYIHMKQIP